MLEEKYKKERFDVLYKKFSKKLTNYLVAFGLDFTLHFSCLNPNEIAMPYLRLRCFGVSRFWEKDDDKKGKGFYNSELGQILKKYCRENNLDWKGSFRIYGKYCLLTDLHFTFHDLNSGDYIEEMKIDELF